MRIVSVEARAWTLPLRAPFATAQRVAYEAQNVRVRVRTEDGQYGDGASAPVEYVTGETVATVLDALASVQSKFEGIEIERLQPLLEKTNLLLFDAPAARAGLEMALYDLWAKHWHIPLFQHFGGAQETLITDVTIPIVPPEEAGFLAEAAVRDGFRALKIKVGDAAGHDIDLARVAAIAQAAPKATLRVDANQAFTPDGAVMFTEALQKTGANIELLEQPVPKEDIAGLKYVREHVGVPVFADEAARSIASVLRLLKEDAVDGVNVKLMKSGLWGAQQIIALCRTAGKKLMLGCMLESDLGIAAAAQIAGGTGAFDFLDLDSQRLLAPIPGLSGGIRYREDQLEIGSQIGNQPGWGMTLPDF